MAAQDKEIVSKSCCDPIIIPNDCGSKKCSQYIDACCLINTASLPCLFPPFTNLAVVSYSSVGSTTIIIDITNGSGDGSIVAADPSSWGVYVKQAGPAVYVGNLVSFIAASPTVTLTIDTPLTFTVSPDDKVILIRQEISQCEINEEIDKKLCACPVWTSIDLGQSGWVNASIDPTTAQLQNLQISDVEKCIVRLRGTIVGPNLSQGFNGIFTVPTTHIPLKTRRFTVNNVYQGVSNILIVDWFLQINGASDTNPGLVSFYVGQIFTPGIIEISFDGITYETN